MIKHLKLIKSWKVLLSYWKFWLRAWISVQCDKHNLSVITLHILFFCLPECSEYYFLHEDKCVGDCPTGYFASEKQQECVRCHADCASCDGPDIDDCEVCRNPKAVRYNGECLSECPNNTFYDKNTNECRGVELENWSHSNTHNINTSVMCVKKMASHFSQTVTSHVWPAQDTGPRTASAVIPTDGKTPADTVCGTVSAPGTHTWIRTGNASSATHSAIAAPGQEKTTASAATSHASCWVSHQNARVVVCVHSGVLPIFLTLKISTLCVCPSDNTCLKQCPVGYYAEDKDERVCERCHLSCQSCVGHHSVQCVTCKPGFFKQGSSCVEACSERLEDTQQTERKPSH